MGMLHGPQLVMNFLFFFIGFLLDDFFFISKAGEHFQHFFLLLALDRGNLIQSLVVISIRTLYLMPQLYLNLIGLKQAIL